MRPAASIVLFTTIAGAAQGVAVALAVATLAGRAPLGALPTMLGVVVVMLVGALVASFFHLGHPLRAWRAVLMWRTSWMSREVIALPVFIAIVAAWCFLSATAPGHPANQLLAWLVIVGAGLLWYCTAMIYACIRFIQEWAHPLTIVNYTTLGLASGLVLCGALAIILGERDFAQAIGAWAAAAIALAWFTRTLSLRRNAKLKPASTVQSATGINATRIVQKSMGMTGGSFNTREFFHGASMAAFRMARVSFQVLAFGLPLLLLAWAVVGESGAAWLLAFLCQALGLLIERWFFFAQARHPQNIYYQVVS
ncbi:MAG TPA: DmsC/YnfH family molybdoenzyme membrane anchor subunit [Ramlibacter sp.]|nr:DmsC/YnfH family molybdoenzyme membrane anchor subunit [Ramlibacter sp.]